MIQHPPKVRSGNRQYFDALLVHPMSCLPPDGRQRPAAPYYQGTRAIGARGPAAATGRLSLELDFVQPPSVAVRGSATPAGALRAAPVPGHAPQSPAFPGSTGRP